MLNFCKANEDHTVLLEKQQEKLSSFGKKKKKKSDKGRELKNFIIAA